MKNVCPPKRYLKNPKTSGDSAIIPIGYLFDTVILTLRLVSSPIENLVVGEDADHRRRQGSHDTKYLSERHKILSTVCN